MIASKEILSVWHSFDDFPMETLTKAWVYSKGGHPKQRDVETMKKHREQYGITGNCFDLAIWLLDAFKEAGVEAYPIGSELGTEEAHAAVIAVDGEGRRFLCDLGDQWLQPVLIDADSNAYRKDKLSGFFPGAEVQVVPDKASFEVIYHRPNGKVLTQNFSSEPVAMKDFLDAAEYSQNHVYPKALLEIRFPYKNEIAHWEFFNWKSFLSTSEGLYPDAPAATIEEWVERIGQKTGYDRQFLMEALTIYKEMNDKKRVEPL